MRLIQRRLDLGADPLAEGGSRVLPIDMLVESEAADGSPIELRRLLVTVTNAARLIEGSGLKDVLNGISMVSVLLVTMTFVGMLNPPGGPTPNSGYIR